MTSYVGKCPKCGTKLAMRPERVAVPQKEWKEFWGAFDVLFEKLDKMFTNIFKN